MKAFILQIILCVFMVNKVHSETITITPTGGDDAILIQNTLDHLNSGDTLQLNGDFVFGKTLYLPSNFVWILDGTLTLDANADLNQAGWVAPGIDATRRTGITEKIGGAININMSGGTYYGNSVKYKKSMRFLNFVSVTHSKFYDMHITEVTDDNFTLGPGSNNNECRNLIGSYSLTGNAMTDKGDHNIWYDCIAKYCLGPDGDGWTPKCRYSTFIRCIAANNVGPGFGMYAREEGHDNDKDVGAHGHFSANSEGKDTYMTFVDFIGHKDLSEKTVLFLVNGIYAQNSVSGVPHLKWQMKPFNNRWPSSLFASQDGVAIDAVGLDFLLSEWPDMPDLKYSEKYLIEAAQAENPPSKTFYDPENDGIKCNSLGVMETWNSYEKKQYSRNLGADEGIDLNFVDLSVLTKK